MTSTATSDLKFRCPTCKKQVTRGSDYFPFCSDRCKIIDLGAWASGDYSIAGEDSLITEDPEGHA